MICTEDETSQLVTAQDAFHLCRNYNISTMCTAAARLGGANESITWSTTVTTVETNYDFLVLSCIDDYTFNIDASWHCVNPGGEELSTGEIPLKSMTVGFASTWIILLSLFVCTGIVSLIRYRLPPEWLALAGGNNDPSSSEPQLNYAIRYLHIAISIPPLILAVSSFISSKYWQTLSLTGNDDPSLSLTDSLVWDLAGAAVIAVALAVGRGWQVTRLRIEWYEFRHIMLLCLAYIIISVSNQFVGGIFFLFLQVLLVVLLIRFLFASVSWSLRLLHTFRTYAFALARTSGNSNNSSNNNNSYSEEYYYENSAANQSLLSPSSVGVTATSGDGSYINSNYYGGYYGATMAVPKPSVTSPNTSNGNGSSETSTTDETQQTTKTTVTDTRSPPLSPGYLDAIRSSSLSSSASSGTRNPSSISDPNYLHSSSNTTDVSTGSRIRTSIGNGYHSIFSSVSNIFSGNVRSSSNGGGVYRELGGGNRSSSSSSSSTATLYDGGLTGRQIKALRYYRSTIVAYLSVQVFLTVWASMEEDTVPWITYLLQQLATLTVFVYLLFVFRPRADPSKSVLYDPRGYIGTNENLLGNRDTYSNQDTSNSHFVILNPDSNGGPIAMAEIE